MQTPEVSTSVREGNKSTCVDIDWRGHLSLNEPTSIRADIKSYTGGQSPSDLTEDPRSEASDTTCTSMPRLHTLEMPIQVDLTQLTLRPNLSRTFGTVDPSTKGIKLQIQLVKQIF